MDVSSSSHSSPTLHPAIERAIEECVIDFSAQLDSELASNGTLTLVDQARRLVELLSRYLLKLEHLTGLGMDANGTIRQSDQSQELFRTLNSSAWTYTLTTYARIGARLITWRALQSDLENFPNMALPNLANSDFSANRNNLPLGHGVRNRVQLEVEQIISGLQLTSKSDDPGAQTNMTESCTVCLCAWEAEEDIAIMPCHQHHLFHLSCIRAWFQISLSCPICRAKVV